MIQTYRVHTGPCNAKPVADAFATVPGVTQVMAGTEHVWVYVNDDILLGTDIERTVKATESARAAWAYCGFDKLICRWLWAAR